MELNGPLWTFSSVDQMWNLSNQCLIEIGLEKFSLVGGQVSPVPPKR